MEGAAPEDLIFKNDDDTYVDIRLVICDLVPDIWLSAVRKNEVLPFPRYVFDARTRICVRKYQRINFPKFKILWKIWTKKINH